MLLRALSKNPILSPYTRFPLSWFSGRKQQRNSREAGLFEKMKILMQMQMNKLSIKKLYLIVKVKEREKRREYIKQKQAQKMESLKNMFKSYYGFSNRTKVFLMFGALAYIFYSIFANKEVNKTDSTSYNYEIAETQFIELVRTKGINRVKVIRKVQNGYKKWHTIVVGYNGTVPVAHSKVYELHAILRILDKLPIPVYFYHHSAAAYSNSQEDIRGKLWVEIFFTLAIIYLYYKISVGGMQNILRPGSKTFEPTSLKVKTTFQDVAGQKYAKSYITEFVEFLKNPKKFTDMGAKTPRGALLTGPPGTGKTLLAKACAGEAGVPFFYMSGSEFIEKFVGVGSGRVRSLFASASKEAPSIIFIDEIDAIGKKRSSGPRSNYYRYGTLNQLLVCMDGFGTNSNVVVMGATNRKDMLDPALLRPGRFDRIIEVSLPDLEGREYILKVHLTKVKCDDSMTKYAFAKRIASLTPGFSGADLSNICNEAAILAARYNKYSIEMIHFEKATERVLAGLYKNNTLTEMEKKIIAYHESARALVSWLLEGGDPMIKLTILPRSKKSFGYSQFLPNQTSLYKESELLDKICCSLAGRVAYYLCLDKVTDTSNEDLARAKKIAFSMVTKYGMSSVVSNIGYPDHELIRKPYSQYTYEKIDDEIMRILNEQTERAKTILVQNREKLEKLAQTVLRKETLVLDDIKEILGERPFEAKSNFKKYLELSEKDGKTQPPPEEKHV